MSISRIKQIKRILKEHDVRDPRGALAAIEQVAFQPKAEKPEQVEPLLTLTMTRTGKNTMEAAVRFDKENLQPRHVTKAIESLQDFGNDVFGECNDPDCPVHGENAKPTSLNELFKQFEAEAQKAAGIKKGNLQ